MTSLLTTPKGAVSIRPAVAQDAVALFNLRLEALRLHPVAFAADVELTEKSGTEAWAERLDEFSRENSGVVIVAEAGNELVGMTGLGRGHWPKTWHGATLWGVYARPAWRGLGIGEALVNGCVQWGLQNSLAVIYLGVVTSNTAAIRCYERCGFTTYGSQPRVICYDDVYYDELLMAKLL